MMGGPNGPQEAGQQSAQAVSAPAQAPDAQADRPTYRTESERQQASKSVAGRHGRHGFLLDANGLLRVWARLTKALQIYVPGNAFLSDLSDYDSELAADVREAAVATIEMRDAGEFGPTPPLPSSNKPSDAESAATKFAMTVTQAACDLDHADPDHDETLCISIDDLHVVVERLAASRLSVPRDGVLVPVNELAALRSDRERFKEALDFYAEPRAYYDPMVLEQVRVPDFYSELNFGDHATNVLNGGCLSPRLGRAPLPKSPA